MLPIRGGGQTYCQSAFGWSDTWFPTSGTIGSYDQRLDVLSGDNAPSVFWRTGPPTNQVGHGTGNVYNFLSPFGDIGTLNSVSLAGTQTTLKGGGLAGGPNDISVVGNVGTSIITINGLDIAIRTVVGANGITETFTFTNNTDIAITELYFDDYFNFHANGSLNTTDTACPTTQYAGGVVTTKGSNAGGCSAIVKDGSMFGSLTPGGAIVLPNFFDVGSTAQVLAAMIAANTGNFGGFNSNTGAVIGDGAADFVWNLGALGVGASSSFTINKNFQRIPEPATLLLFGAGLAGIGLTRRRRSS